MTTRAAVTELPPPGTDPSGVAEYVDRLVRESADDPRRVQWLEEAERNYQLYLGQHWTTATPEGEIRLQLNRTQNAIVSLVSLQAGDPPKISFSPRESGEPPLYYLNTELPEAAIVIARLTGAVDPGRPEMSVTQTTEGEDGSEQEESYEQPERAPDPLAGAFADQATGQPTFDFTQPLPDAIGKQLKAEVEMSIAVAAQQQAGGMPPSEPPLPEELIVEVTDSTASQALQTVFDAMWEGADAQAIFTECVLNKNILGWQTTLVEFDDEHKKHVLTNIHPKQVFPDPLNSDNKRWAYCVFDQPISKSEALKKWPHLAASIMEYNLGSPGSLIFPGSRNYDHASMFDQTFQREMVVVRTAWIRCQSYPMTEQEAVAAGRVTPGEALTGETEEVEAQPAEDGTQMVDEQGAPQRYQQPVMRPALFDALDPVKELAPGSPGWPVRYGIRQVMIVAGSNVVDDRECEYPEIPLVVNKNIPVPFSTYGQGEPKRLEGLQMAVNRILSAFVTYHAYNAYPPEMVAESVVEMMDEALRDCRTKPGQRLAIPDSLILQLGDVNKIVTNMEQGTMTADFWRLLDLLVQYIDMEGNQADVIQGEASASWSGKTVDALQSAANQVIRGKAIYTEYYLKNLTTLLVHAIVHRLTPIDWKRIISRYPVQVLNAFSSRLKSLDVDVVVEIASGSGSSKRNETNNLIMARANGVPVSDPELLERMGVDPDTQLQKQSDWMRKMAALQGPPQPQQGPGGEGEGGEEKDDEGGDPRQRTAKSKGRPSNNGSNGSGGNFGRN